MKTFTFLFIVFFIGSFFSNNQNTFGQITDQLIIVPAVPDDPAIPYVVPEHTYITLKAIIRNATSTSGYTITWDLNNDGDFSNDDSFQRYPNTAINGVRDIGTTYVTPFVSIDTYFNISVKVVNNSTNNTIFGTSHLFVKNWTPDPNPLNWTDEQIKVMRETAIQEDMWYLHKYLSYLQGADVNNIQGHYGNSNTDAYILDLFLSNGRFPAYPPGTLNSYGITLPASWESHNDYLWNLDPYAETVLRIMNYQLSTLSSVSIPAGSEDNTCGFDQNGNEIICNRIAGTNNNKGIRTSLAPSDAGIADGTAQILSGLAKSLYVHNGVPVQVGGSGIIGNTMEFVVQEMVDYLVYHQIDGGQGSGGFYYNPVEGSANCLGETGAGVARGLWEAEGFRELYGIIVNNKVKYRMAENIYNQQGSDGLVKRFVYYSGNNNNFNYSGAYLGICHWLGIDKFTLADNNLAFPGYSSYTRAQLRSAYNSYLSASSPLWASATKLDPYNWLDHFWENGDFLSGNTNSAFDQDLGSTFNMFQWATGLSKCYPYLDSIGFHDWERELSINLIRGQERNTGAQPGGPFGTFIDDYCSYNSHSCLYGPPQWSSVLAGRALTAMKGMTLPVADGQVLPEQVDVGDTVLFKHDSSYIHIVLYQWDIDKSDGLSWDNGIDPDFSTTDSDEVFNYSYNCAGTYIATLYVLDNLGHHATKEFSVTVNPALSYPGNCFDFDGADDYVRIQDNNSFDLTTNYTIEAWIKPGYFSPSGGIVSKYQTFGSNGYLLRLHSDAPYTGLCFDEMYTSTGILEQNKWYHIAAVNENGTRKLYLDGELQSLTGTPIIVQANSDPVCIGVDYLQSGNYFNGEIDEVRIWNIARTQTQIRETLHNTLTGTETGLAGYWQLDECCAFSTEDLVSGNDGTLNNMDGKYLIESGAIWKKWQTSGTSDWSTASNWSTTFNEPTTNDMVLIPSGGTQPQINNAVSNPAVCDILKIESGAILTVDAGKALTVYDTIINEAGNTGMILKADESGVASLLHDQENLGATVESYITEDTWHLVSSPVNIAVSNVFLGLYLKYFAEADSSWNYITSISYPLDPGKGFATWSASGSTGNATVSYTGKLFANDLPLSLDFTTAASHGGKGWNLIGNPFPSAVEWQNNWGQVNIDNTIYVYNGSQYYTWNHNNGSTGFGTKGNGDIPVGQGFWVKANNAGPSLIIPQNNRKHSSQNFYKTGQVLDNILFFTIEGNDYSDKMIVYLNEQATSGFDADWDAYKLKGIVDAPQLFSNIPGAELSVNVLPYEEKSIVISIGLEVGNNAIYTLNAQGVEYFDQSIEIYIEDLIEDKIIDLRQTSTYSFTANPTDVVNRFLLHFNNTAFEINETTEKEISIYSYENNIYIQSPAKDNARIFVYDLIGKLIYEKSTDETFITIPLLKAEGIYFVKIIKGDEVYFSKVYIK